MRFFRLTASILLLILAGMSDVSAGNVVTRWPHSVRKMDLSPGDTVTVADGVYENTYVQFLSKGRPEAPIVLRAQTPGGVVFSKGSSVKIAGSYLVLEGFRFEKQEGKVGSYVTFADTSARCRVSDCLFDGSACAPDSRSRNFVQLRGSFNEVSHCAFLDKKTIGVCLAVNIAEGHEVHHVIKNNFFWRPYVYRDARGGRMNGQECIRVGSSTWSLSKDAGCVVSDNWFWHCDGEIETISNKSCGNLYERNLLEECVGTITLRHGNDCTVRDNYFIGNGRKGTGGVRIIGERHLVENNKMYGLRGRGTYSAVSVINGFENPELHEYFRVVGAVVRGNEIVDCGYGFHIALAMRPENVLKPEGLRIEDNVVVASEKQKTVIMDMDPSKVKWKKNRIYGGVQEGSSFKETSRRPTLQDHTAALDAIRSGAGVSYWKPQLSALNEYTGNQKLQD